MIFEYREISKKEKKIEIKNCPFCGSDDLKPVHHQGSYGYSKSEDYVKCLTCGATGGYITDNNCGKHTEESIAKWNRRN